MDLPVIKEEGLADIDSAKAVKKKRLSIASTSIANRKPLIQRSQKFSILSKVKTASKDHRKMATENEQNEVHVLEDRETKEGEIKEEAEEGIKIILLLRYYA